MAEENQCHICGKPAFGDLKGKGDVDLPICLAHFIEYGNMQNDRDRLNDSQARLTIAMLNDSYAQFEAVTGMPVQRVHVPPAAPAPTYHAVNIHNSTVGAVNTGTVQQITATVSVMPNEHPARKALVDFMAAVTESQALTDEGKRQLLEPLSVISDEAAAPPEKRKRSVVASLLGSVGQASQAVHGVADAWNAVEPILKNHFGLQ